MSAIDIVRAFVSAVESNDAAEIANPLADDFLFSGFTPKPLDKANFIATFRDLKAGIPGLIFNLHNLAEQEHNVTGSIQIAGYQSGAFSIPSLSLSQIPQMARSVSLPDEDVTFGMTDDKIASWHIQHVAGGDMKGLLHQLGIDEQIFQ